MDLPPTHTVRVLISINEELLAISLKLLHKTWANKYIDFAELPLAKSKPRSLPHYLEGQVLLVQMQELDHNKKTIPDFTTWAQCFVLYAAAILQRQPGQATDLMIYFFILASNARRYRWPSCLIYDQNFCQKMANTQDIVWAKTNAIIFALCFLNAEKSSETWCRTCYSVDHPMSSCPQIPPPRPRAYHSQHSLRGEGPLSAGISTRKAKDAGGGLTATGSIHNKLILQYLKTRRCKYYTLNNSYCINIQYYSAKQKYTSTEPSSQD